MRFSVITKCDKCYYKVQQFCYKMRQVLQSATEQPRSRFKMTSGRATWGKYVSGIQVSVGYPTRVHNNVCRYPGTIPPPPDISAYCEHNLRQNHFISGIISLERVWWIQLQVGDIFQVISMVSNLVPRSHSVSRWKVRSPLPLAVRDLATRLDGVFKLLDINTWRVYTQFLCPSKTERHIVLLLGGKRSIVTSGIANRDRQIILLADLVYKNLLY